MDSAPLGGLQLRAGQDKLVKREQGSRLLLPGAVIQKRYAATAGDVAPSAVSRGRFAESDDDGGAKGSGQELRRPV